MLKMTVRTTRFAFFVRSYTDLSQWVGSFFFKIVAHYFQAATSIERMVGLGC